MHRQFNIGYFFSVGFIIHKEMEDSSKLWSAIEYKFKKMEISVGRGWVQIQATEKDRDEALFDTEEIFKLHQSGIQKHSNFYIGGSIGIHILFKTNHGDAYKLHHIFSLNMYFQFVQR